MPRIVSVTRILNEDDIVEAFVRHNAAHIHHMLFLDNGSTDATLEILKSLQTEGLPLTVFQNPSVSFDEIAANTWAYQLASQIHQAEWVAFLDADEFIAAPAPLATLLPAADAMSISLLHYGQTGAENASQIIVPLRLRWRLRTPAPVKKLIIRGGLGAEVLIEAGNHGAQRAGQPVAAPLSPAVQLAHYPRRNGYQNLQKIAAGWLKVLAAGRAETAAGRSQHYRSPFETLRDKPWELIAAAAYLDREIDPALAEEAPLNYLGGPLKYWRETDPAMKAVNGFLNFAESLARQHGRLLDEAPGARALVETWHAKRDFLF
jgi:hypothetical protein